MDRNPEQLSDKTYDVLVVGGGIYGVCVAWDAALRGLSVALVEKGDFGHATSSNSLRIIHGGFRYLQHGLIRRMRQLIHERAAFMRIAPHLVHPLPFLIPTYRNLMRSKEALNLALLANDLVGFDRNHLADPQKRLPRGRVISREECLAIAPGLEEKDLTGAAIVYDSQMSNSERLVMSFARSASQSGADLANYVEVTGLLADKGKVAGVKAKDRLKGNDLDIRARFVVNTSGPWLDRVANLLQGDRSRPMQTLSKAFNILVNCQWVPEYAVGVYGKRAFRDQEALLNKGSRLFFITPWQKRSLIGTAHLPYDAHPDGLRMTEEEIEGFLAEINDAYPAAGLKRQDVAYVFGGLVPMVKNGHRTADVQLMKRYLIHDHQREHGGEGLISVSSVKYTEARHVAEKVVNLIFEKLGKKAPSCRTAITPLHGGQIEQFDSYVNEQVRRNSLPEHIVRRLILQYGTAYAEVLKSFDSHTEGMTDTSRVMKAEVLHAVRKEMAQKLADVVFRRTGSGMTGNPGEACLRSCAAVMAEELGWDDMRVQKEVEEVSALF